MRESNLSWPHRRPAVLPSDLGEHDSSYSRLLNRYKPTSEAGASAAAPCDAHASWLFINRRLYV